MFLRLLFTVFLFLLLFFGPALLEIEKGERSLQKGKPFHWTEISLETQLHRIEDGDV